jgi:hypothetical protein
LGIVFQELQTLSATPIATITSRTITAIGAMVGLVVTLLSVLSINPFSLTDLGTLPLRLWSWLTAFFRAKRKNWGVVYNSITKEPLDPAYVVLKDSQGSIVGTSITDIDGRYGFLTKRGIYTIEASKTGYLFPSKLGKKEDELYSDLYYGEAIHIEEDGEIIKKNIPLDPMAPDWNAQAKIEQKLMTYYTNRDKMLARVSLTIFTIGFFVSLLAIISNPVAYNIIIFLIYVTIIVLRTFGFTQKGYGAVVDSSGFGIPFSIIRIFSPSTNIEIARKVSDETGRYYCLIQNGTYYATIEKKNGDGSYTRMLKTDEFEVKSGIVKEIWNI